MQFCLISYIDFMDPAFETIPWTFQNAWFILKNTEDLENSWDDYNFLSSYQAIFQLTKKLLFLSHIFLLNTVSSTLAKRRAGAFPEMKEIQKINYHQGKK